jgi:hypothetical protein
MTIDSTDYKPPEVLIPITAFVFFILLIAPWTPPQVALFASVAVVVIGTMLWVAFQYASSVTYKAVDSVLPEIPDEKEKRSEAEKAYIRGEIDEVEFERRREKELE